MTQSHIAFLNTISNLSGQQNICLPTLNNVEIAPSSTRSTPAFSEHIPTFSPHFQNASMSSAPVFSGSMMPPPAHINHQEMNAAPLFEAQTPVFQTAETVVQKNPPRANESATHSEVAVKEVSSVEDSAQLKRLVLKIVVDKTGYPLEMLTDDMDIEADLGIDSIKRVEILSSLREIIPNLRKWMQAN